MGEVQVRAPDSTDLDLQTGELVAISGPSGSGKPTLLGTPVDDRAELRPVNIGMRGRRHAQVLGGLEVGDSVILYPSDQVEEGVRVRMDGGP